MPGRDQDTIRIFANREVRMVPRGWKHPQDSEGALVPLLASNMPDAGESAEIATYETTSDGTPISPAFPNNQDGRIDLVRYCTQHCTINASHRAGAEAWAAVLFGKHTVVTGDGTVEAE